LGNKKGSLRNLICTYVANAGRNYPTTRMCLITTTRISRIIIASSKFLMPKITTYV